MKKTSGLELNPILLAFLWGTVDYTWTMAVVKVTFLLNDYGDRIAEQ
jgi:hypothetical protein